jgi:hypothetical protein
MFLHLDKYSFSLIAFSSLFYFAISYILYRNNYEIVILIEKIAFFTHIITFLIPFLINPGIPKRGYYTKKFEKEYKGDFKQLIKCDKCNIIIPKKLKTGHCIYCNICIKGYDHHCAWIGKCVGKYTKIPFYFFLFGILFYLVSTIVTFITFLRNLYLLIN